jgi:acetylglutamate kinase
MNNVTVIKLGGSLLDNPAVREAALRKVVARWNAGEQIVLVHGGGKHIDAALQRAGLPKRTHAGLRITDDATLDVVVSVLGGTVNKMLVSELSKLGVRAAGLSGCDGGTLIARQHPAVDGVELGRVGQVTRASRGLLGAMLTSGAMPVVSSIAIGDDGALYNVNADTAAAAIATALGARELRFLTDVPGLFDESGAVVPHLNAARLEAMLSSPAVSGGMKPKLQAALGALKAGVAQITIGLPPTTNRQLPTEQEGGTTLVAA